MKTLNEVIEDLEKDEQESPQEQDPAQKLNTKIRILKDLVDALIDLGAITGMWDTKSIRISVKNVVKSGPPKTDDDVIERQERLKHLLVKDHQTRKQRL